MKSEALSLAPTPQPLPHDFQAFFEALEVPAALCAPDLSVRLANAPFRSLCGGVGDLRALLSGVVVELPGEGASTEVEVGVGGRRVHLLFSCRGGHLSVLARPASGREEAPGRVLLELSRQMLSVSSEEMLVAAVARGMKRLFPGAFFCVQLADPVTLELSSLYAEGRLREGTRGRLVLKKSALEKLGLDGQGLPEERVRVVEAPPPLFQASHHSLSAPLVASGQLFGALTLEYPEGRAADLEGDHGLLLQLANQVAVAVRNVKLIEELTFVRGYLEQLLERASALIVLVDRQRRVQLFNKALRELTGLGREEVLGQDLLHYLPESEHARAVRSITVAFEGREGHSFETRVLGDEGREVRVSLATSAVRNAQGEVEGVLCIGQDLTQLRQLEQRIIQAEKLASLGQLAASVAHEINNPMTAVATYADSLLQQVRLLPGAGGVVDKLRKISEASQRILRFTGDLVSYARPAADSPEPLDLHQALEMAVGFCDHVVAQAGVLLVKDFGPPLPVAGVKGKLAQVFVNLVTNACHATPAGGTVTVRTRREGSEAVVEVADTGQGIEKGHLERIFEPFFTTKPHGRGTGLGLSIVQGIVETHGGVIRVQSAVGVGTTFVLRLPLRS